jgi:hypothetical protein
MVARVHDAQHLEAISTLRVVEGRKRAWARGLTHEPLWATASRFERSAGCPPPLSAA